MSKSVDIVGAGIAGLSVGCYLQMNGYRTQIFEQHELPGGLCTSWKRAGYTFDNCVQWLLGSAPGMRLHDAWQELGALPGPRIVDHEEFLRVVGADGATLVLYTNVDRLERHLHKLAPEDGRPIRELTNLIRRQVGFDFPFGKPRELMTPLDRLKVAVLMLPSTWSFVRYGRVSLREFASRFRSLSCAPVRVGPWAEGQSGRLLLQGRARRQARPRGRGREGLPGHGRGLAAHSTHATNDDDQDRCAVGGGRGRHQRGATVEALSGQRGAAGLTAPNPALRDGVEPRPPPPKPTPVLTGVKAVLAALRAHHLDPGSGPAISGCRGDRGRTRIESTNEPQPGNRVDDFIRRAEGARERGRHAQAQHGEGLGHAFAQARRRAGVGAVELGGQRAQFGLGGQRGVGVIRTSHPGGDRGAQLLREVIFDVSDLVELAPAPTKGHRPGAVAVAYRRAPGVVAALGPHTAVTAASMIAAISCRPVPTARANRPSRISPANSPSATLTVSGTAGWLVSISCFW